MHVPGGIASNWLGASDRSQKCRECVLIVFSSSSHSLVTLAGFNYLFCGGNFIDI